jgi:hypothetical protein
VCIRKQPARFRSWYLRNRSREIARVIASRQIKRAA